MDGPGGAPPGGEPGDEALVSGGALAGDGIVASAARWARRNGIELAAVAVVLAYAGAVRFAQVDVSMTPGDLSGDILRYYYTPARHMLEGRGFFQDNGDSNSPLQAVFFAAAMLWDRGLDLVWMQRVQVGVSLVGLAGAWAWARMAAGRGAAIVFLSCLAVFDLLIFYTPKVGTEANYLALFFISMALWQGTMARPQRLGLAGATGLAVAFTALQRFNAVLLVPMMALMVALCGARAGRRKRGIAGAVVMVAAFCLPVAVWVARNYEVYGRFVPTVPRSGVIFHQSNFANLDNASQPYWEDYHYTWGWMDESIEQYGREVRYTSLFEPLIVSSNLYQSKARDYILAYPGHVFRNYAIRWGNQFVLPPAEVSGARVAARWWPGWLAGLQRVSVWLILPGLLVYCWRRGGSVAAWGPVVVFGYYVFLGAVFHITKDGRMNLLLKCLGFLWTAVAVAEMGRWVWRKPGR